MAPPLAGKEPAVRESPEGPVRTKASPYITLDKALAENHIRIAKISSAASEGEDVHCELLHIARDDPLTRYRALSYAWGPAVGRRLGQIYIGDAPYPVARSLGMALRRLRPKKGPNGRPLLIWIDALCINQENPEEKAEQVSKMRFIYQQALEISIWLGPGDWSPQSHLAWRLIKYLIKCPRDVDALANIVHPSRENDFDALRLFFRRDYFWRTWVVQEVTCVKEAMAYYGSDAVPWSGLLEVCDKLSDARGLLRRFSKEYGLNSFFY